MVGLHKWLNQRIKDGYSNNVESAIRIGRLYVMHGVPGASNEDITLKGLARLINDASKWNIPIGAEMLPRGFEPVEDSRTWENIALHVELEQRLEQII